MDITKILTSAESAAAWAEQQAQEALAMRNTTVREEGLLNAAQAALLLEVSPQRVRELMNLGILSRFEFLGHVYLSYREVKQRREKDIQSGRPKRNLLKRVSTSIKAAMLTDGNQLKQGGYAGPYIDKKYKDSKKKNKK